MSNFKFTLKKQGFSTSISEEYENVYLFVFFGVWIHIQNFFDVVRNKIQIINVY